MFKPVSSQVSLPILEDEVSKFWKENNIFQKSIDNRSSDNPYIFVDGPPFVTGSPHYGSLLPSIAKDMVPRYQTMLGKRVRRVFGWDCHGLPIEEKVSKLFGIKSNAQLEEKFGVERYVKECRKYVQSVTSDWRWYVEKIGRWVDMDNAYYTMNFDFMESVLWAFKQIYDKGLIYKGKRVSLYSTDTSTPVSQFEVAMDPDNYRDMDDLSIFVKFKLKESSQILVDEKLEKKPVYMLAWTTTPWTIPSNFALAVNKNFTYSLVEYDNEYFVVAKERLAYAFNKPGQEIGTLNEDEVKILKEFKGEQLKGLSYQPVYDFFVDQANKNDFVVYLSEDVTGEEGTGVLHIAPAFGEVDFILGQKNGISVISNIDVEGKITVGPWTGVYIREASPLITEDLQKKGLLLRSEVYKHRLPFYRGANPLIYMVQDAYFIDIQKIKERMLRLNQDINWIPKHIKNGRFRETLETAPDWCISRNRYWATIMPIWKSEDGEEIIIGSVEEMMNYTDQIQRKKAGDKVKYFFNGEPMDLHRDICDKIILTKEGKIFKRISEVLDCWMDSGSVPFAEYHYPFENKETFEKSRPADFIVEYTPQVRAWFNVLLRVSTIIFDDNPFTNAICHGTIAGSDGRKMSKSFGNYPDPKMVLEKYGGDALRVYLMGSPVMKGEDMNFYEEGVAENYRFLLVFWNTYKFFIDYAILADWEGGELKDMEELGVLDKWILASLAQLTDSLRRSFDSYDVVLVTNSLKKFTLEDFSTWYIRRSRDRVDPSAENQERNMVLAVMYKVLVTVCKLAAPLVPFITEDMFKNLTGKESVHLENYPEVDKSLLDEKLLKDMVLVRKLVEIGHAQRKEVGAKLRQPLSKFTYFLPERLSKDLELVLAEELNVKTIEYGKSPDEVTGAELTGELGGKLDTKITPELAAEGDARDLARQVQSLRKESGLTLKDRIKIVSPNVPEKPELVQIILRQTNAEGIKKGDKLSIEVI